MEKNTKKKTKSYRLTTGETFKTRYYKKPHPSVYAQCYAELVSSLIQLGSIEVDYRHYAANVRTAVLKLAELTNGIKYKETDQPNIFKFWLDKEHCLFLHNPNKDKSQH